jgi:hypothetical protein
MTILTFPTLTTIPRPAQLDWRLLSNTQKFESPLTKTIQTMELPGARWAASFTLENLPDDDAAKLQSFLVKLRGQAGRFYMWNMARENPRGIATGTPLVNGASQSGITLAIDGCNPNITNWLLEGDYFEVNGELKMVTANCNTNESGQTAITFEPPLRSSPPDNAVITLTKPKCKMMLNDAEVSWNTRSPIITNIPISCIEVLI